MVVEPETIDTDDPTGSERRDRLRAAAARLPLAAEVQPARLERMVDVASHRLSSLTVVLENVFDPHNASAVVRTAEGFGLEAVHAIENPQRFRLNAGVTHGAERWIALRRHRQLEECLDQLHDRGMRTVAADLGPGCVPLGEISVERPLALVLGTEKHGLSDAARRLVDQRCEVPMPGFTDSLNVSVCAAVALWELSSRRRRFLGRSSDLDDDAVLELVDSWLGETVARAERRRSSRRGPGGRSRRDPSA